MILAHLPDPHVETYLAAAELHTTYGPDHSPEAVRQRIALTRWHGYGTNPGLIVTGSWGMAAAVFGLDRSPVGALSITGVEHRVRRGASRRAGNHAVERRTPADSRPRLGPTTHFGSLSHGGRLGGGTCWRYHLPLHSGARLLKKAAIPSCMSWEPTTKAFASRVTSHPASSPALACSAFNACSVTDTA